MVCSIRAAMARILVSRSPISCAVYNPRCRLSNRASSIWGRYPSRGTPVSRSSTSARLRHSSSEQSFKITPATWEGCRNSASPRICAASVRLAPLGRSTRITGRSRVSATCQALACTVVPPTPSYSPMTPSQTTDPCLPRQSRYSLRTCASSARYRSRLWLSTPSTAR